MKNNQEHFVFEDTEVRKTGRTAVRTIKNSVSGRERRMTLVEITPVNEFDWKKWVDPDQLYRVIDDLGPD